jgi:hypothetical protein
MSDAADSLFYATDLPKCKPGEAVLYPLPTLSLWHVWQLQVLDSPYAVGGNLNQFSRLQAAIVALNTRRQWLSRSDSGALDAQMKAIAERYALLSPAEKQAYREYVDAHMTHCLKWPEYWQDGKSTPLKCPFVWHAVRNLLAMRICQTEAEAWDYPAARAMCWLAVENETQGGKNYISQAERDTAEALNHG